MQESLNEGFIFLIPKEGGDRDDIRHWRPITILNSTCKILAKALSLRLQPMLDSLIHATQTGFVKKRSILDNIFTFWEAISLARLEQSHLQFYSLILRKPMTEWIGAFLRRLCFVWASRTLGFGGLQLCSRLLIAKCFW